MEWLQSNVLDGPLGVTVRVLAIVLAALIAQGIVRVAFRILARRAQREIDLEGLDDSNTRGQRGKARRALASGTLIRSAATLGIWTLATFLVLETLGVNLGPILASAGVLGIVIGFGAQSLVADYLAGASMIFANQIGVGDVVETDVVRGVVEEVALRTTTIRDFNGSIWYVRNGQMQYLCNQSQGSTVAAVDIPVAFDADLGRVRDVLNAAGQAMVTDPELEASLLDAPAYSGVQDLTGNAVIIRAVARIRPATQLPATRLIRQRFKEALDEAGISIPWQHIEIEQVGPTSSE